MLPEDRSQQSRCPVHGTLHDADLMASCSGTVKTYRWSVDGQLSKLVQTPTDYIVLSSTRLTGRAKLPRGCAGQVCNPRYTFWS